MKKHTNDQDRESTLHVGIDTLRLPINPHVAPREGLIVDRVASLLVRTSRTFALTIPYLPPPVRQEVTLAYLLLRVADTLEDATLWTNHEIHTALQAFATWLDTPTPEAATRLVEPWQRVPPCGNNADRELLLALPELATELLTLDATARASITRHARRTALGMAAEIGAVPTTLAELQRYCYAVAGIVGEMLTELFLPHLTLTLAQRERLQTRAVPFGEGLQLVNILKDAATDHAEGRAFLPAGVPKEVVFALAMANLTHAQEYAAVLAEANAPSGYLMFTRLPIALAEATLNRVRQHGPGAKLTRDEVAALQQALENELRDRQA